jgi:glycosyltransferase involved in cell wall biosynthesis
MSSETNQPDPIAISVVVPVRNEESSVCVLLEGLLSQTLPPNEIVITDGGSTDSTRSIIEEFIEHGAPVKLIREEFSMPGRARNIGVAHSSSEWIAFVDAGMIPVRDWLSQLAAQVGTDPHPDVVYGSWEPVTNTFFKECAALAYVPPVFEQGGEWMRHGVVASSLVRRDAWHSVGGFSEELRSGEDLLFVQKLADAGFCVARAPRAIVYWNIQPTFWRTFKRFVSYSRHNARAGLFAQWQGAIFTRYGLLVLLSLLALKLGPQWLIVTLVLSLLFLALRALRSLWRNRKCYPANLRRQALRMLFLIPLLAVIDAATVIGTLNWVIIDRFHVVRRNDGFKKS